MIDGISEQRFGQVYGDSAGFQFGFSLWFFPSMIPVKDAIFKAVEYPKWLLDNERASQLRLEEVETRSDGWAITLSMPQINSFGFPSQRREYKTFIVDGQTGEVLSMKIRELTTIE